MYKKRLFASDDELKDILPRLQKQVRLSYGGDTVTSESFSIHRSISNSPRFTRDFLEFKFKGSILRSGEKTELHYRVMPPLLWMAMLAFHSVLFIYAVFQLLFKDGSVLFLLLALFFAAGLFGRAEWECCECVKAFESKLK